MNPAAREVSTPTSALASASIPPRTARRGVMQLLRLADRLVGRSLGRRFVTLSLGLLLVIQLTSFFVIDASLNRHAAKALPEQLAMGVRTLQGLLGWRSEKLLDAARLLAADYGFRSAVLSNDRETIASVLSNHGARIGASEVTLLAADLSTIAQADGATASGPELAAAVAHLAPRAVRAGGASQIAVIAGQARHVVLVPIKAPLLMGWVLMCFSLPEQIAANVHMLSATDLTLLWRNAPGHAWVPALSKLPTAQAALLARHAWVDEGPAPHDAPVGMTRVLADGQELGVRALLLTPQLEATQAQPQIIALLSLSVDDAIRPPHDLQVALLLTNLLGFATFGLASAYTARRVTTPLQALASAAERLGSGESTTPIRAAGAQGEVRELAQAFEQMRIDLTRKQEQIVQSEKLASIGQLAAGVAHEINNPIGFVFSNFGSLEDYLARLFKMLAAYREEEAALAGSPAAARLARLRQEIELDYLEEDIPALMSESKDGIKRVRKIVQDLKDFSHVDARQEWELANLHAGLDSTLNIVSNEIKYKADVVKDYGELPLVECLPSELNQVFMNLLVNAAHAIGDKRGTITVRSGVSQPEAPLTGEAWVEVVDDGCGIAAADLKRIFDPFFTTKPVGKGTGLGLSLSYGIVKKHGGRIDVQSEPGRGTSFRVSIPVRRQAGEAA